MNATAVLVLLCTCCTTLTSGAGNCDARGPGGCMFQNWTSIPVSERPGPTACDWSLGNNSNFIKIDSVSNYWGVGLTPGKQEAKLTSRTACSTLGQIHCMSFVFRFDQNNTIDLSVNLKYEGNDQVESPLWILSSIFDEEYGQVEINTSRNFSVVFIAKRRRDQNVGSDPVLIDDIRYNIGRCRTSAYPPHAAPTSATTTPTNILSTTTTFPTPSIANTFSTTTTILTPLTTPLTTPLSTNAFSTAPTASKTTTVTETLTETTTSEQVKPTDTTNEGTLSTEPSQTDLVLNTVGVIVGYVVTAIVFVIIITVLVVVFRRKRQLGKQLEQDDSVCNVPEAPRTDNELMREKTTGTSRADVAESGVYDVLDAPKTDIEYLRETATETGQKYHGEHETDYGDYDELGPPGIDNENDIVISTGKGQEDHKVHKPDNGDYDDLDAPKTDNENNRETAPETCRDDYGAQEPENDDYDDFDTPITDDINNHASAGTGQEDNGIREPDNGAHNADNGVYIDLDAPTTDDNTREDHGAHQAAPPDGQREVSSVASLKPAAANYDRRDFPDAENEKRVYADTNNCQAMSEREMYETLAAKRDSHVYSEALDRSQVAHTE